MTATGPIRALARPLPLCGLLLAAVCGAEAVAKERGLDRFDDPHRDFRRIEIHTPGDFEADCRTRGRRVQCELSAQPTGLQALMAKLHDGALAEATIVRRPKKADGTMTLRLDLARPELEFRQRVVPSPPTWIVEIGIPPVMWPTIELTVPMRPYAVPAAPFESTPPPSWVERLDGTDPDVRAYNECYDAWAANSLETAIQRCNAVLFDHPDSPVVRSARGVLGEAWARRAISGDQVDLVALLAAIREAEESASDPLKQVRFTYLFARALESQELPSRSRRHLEESLPRYRGTPAELFVVSTLAEIEAADEEAAEKWMTDVIAIPGDSRNIGAAYAGLAGIRYTRGRYLEALRAFEVVADRWPGIINKDPSTLFQAAEVFYRFGRIEQATQLYEQFLARYPDAIPHWIVRVRIGELISRTQPDRARAAFQTMAKALQETEGQDLAWLRWARLAKGPYEMARILRRIQRGALTDYVTAEVMVLSVHRHLEQGRIRTAYDELVRLWEMYPGDPVVTESRHLADRTLYLLVHYYLEHDRPMAAASVYYAHPDRFEGHERRGRAHLLAGQSLRKLGMTEESLRVLQRGAAPLVESGEPAVTARLYLEMASVLREDMDRFRLGEILEYMDARFPRRFDNFDYWMAKGMHAWWDGRPREARDMLVYALNGPVTPRQRVELTGEVARIYFALGEHDRAINALETQIEMHAVSGGKPDAPVVHRAMRRIAEARFDAGEWVQAIGALRRFEDRFADDPENDELEYMLGKALLEIGDVEAAGRVWDTLSRESKGTWGDVARQELEMMRWRAAYAASAVDAARIDDQSAGL